MIIGISPYKWTHFNPYNSVCALDQSYKNKEAPEANHLKTSPRTCLGAFLVEVP